MNRQAGAESSPPWWRSAVIYQIYPRSFADSNGDGVGDLAGISSRLDYVAALGVDAIWLSPIYRSPMADFGYDVSDHTAVDPVFGDLRGVRSSARRGTPARAPGSPRLGAQPHELRPSVVSRVEVVA